MYISEINVYPIKSLKGIRVETALVEDRGLEYDRRWMLVDEKGKFLTQREFPKMATIGVAIAGDGLSVTIPGLEPFHVIAGDGEPVKNVKIWSSSVKALWYEGEINDALSEYLGAPCTLTAMGPESKRIVNPIYAVRKFQDTVSFADGYPYLLANEASLDDLNSRLADPVPMNRFRPNFVVTGAEAWAEDGWKKIKIGETIFHVVKPSERCVITTIDQNEGSKTGVEPLKTLSEFRKKGDKVLFAQNLIAESAGAVVRRGDRVEIL